MKKLLLAMLMVTALVCLFAVSVSAAEIPEWGEITPVDGMADKSVFGDDGKAGATSRILMSDGITYPAYYICNNSTTLGISFADLNKAASKSYAAKDLVRIEMPKGTISTSDALKVANGFTALMSIIIPEGVTTISKYAFKSPDTETNSALVEVIMPSTVTSIGEEAFYCCNSLVELIIPDGVTAIPKNMARHATSLKKLILPSSLKSISDTAFRYAGVSGEVVIPEGCTTIAQYAFANTNIETVYIPSTITTMGNYVFTECHSLANVYSKSTKISDFMCYKCESLTTVILENTKTIGKNAFNNPDNGITNISTLVLPEGLTSVGDYAFTRSQLTEVLVPSTVTTMGQSVFQGCKSLKKAVVLGSILGQKMFQDCSAMEELVLTEKVASFVSGCLGSVSSTKFTIYYTGTDYERVCELGTAVSDRFNPNKPSTGKGTSYCSYEEYLSGEYRSYKYTFIYDINLCVAAFGGVHTEPKDDGDCTTAVICSMCKEHTFKAALEHVISERITYVSFTENGEYYNGCVNDGCTCGTVTEKAALFICLGYSASEYSVGEIAIGYMANSDEIALYETVTGAKVTYGLFAVSQLKLGDNDIFGENGAAAGVISYETSRSAFSVFELRLYGFEGTQKDAKVAIGAYVSVKDENGTEYSYIQEGTKAEGDKYYFASYNEMLATIS